MSERRERVLDAAITVLGAGGSRALTHRAVDAAAGLPPGSASNVARTRSELVAGVLDRLLEREVAAWELLAGGRPVAACGTAEERTVRALAGTVRELAGPGRELTLARHAIFVEAALDPALQERIAAARTRIERWGADWLDRLGTPRDADGVRAVLAVVEGWLVLAVSAPTAAPDPEPLLRRALGGS
ncbi:Transcriptional regulator, TetR family [Pseudonocardia sp. Ae168_Ps1]|uniref:TetR/AcrR family transcriptional regulator n=1 Tax=unclassified Pseudonocardia TaxID=2619320 RepID=UPI00094AC211|nr:MULTISPECIES: TetR/AcrR family transcriptional regulator [unclassified Pseudonocardia]OLL72715.1 Transcriptional regulator, TetR family [Pseudonocardia sp. Ae150A_Ps1]OLL78686.1 Transcriptional regulator, TetR family [Pseudonocardia sp. Ae168_Ps1]OLL87185.1 Transcriptional regulator, TetR family [Pseudonocardia sp. Ae263_Ps1]OLL92785.1 Transcriptional regulator, TetR family [Pseudonocardia sp. Ae356_Ps1]